MRLSIGVLALVLLSANVAMAQQVEVGVEGGIRATSDPSGNLTSESKRYIVGPTVNIRLTKAFSVEVDALYQRFGFTGVQEYGFAGSITRERTNSWELPVILKYHLPIRLAHPFVGIGYAPRIVNGTDVSSGSSNEFPPYYNLRTATNYPVTQGVVVSGGVSLGAGHFRFTPEVRYTYWTGPYLNQYVSVAPCCSGQWVSNQNEVSVLLGIRWR
jgi:hypothetical protein